MTKEILYQMTPTVLRLKSHSIASTRLRRGGITASASRSASSSREPVEVD